MKSTSKGASAPIVPAQTVREDRVIYRALKIIEKRLKEPGEVMNSPQRVRDYLRLLLTNLEREAFVCLFLNSQNRVIEAETLFYGTLTQTSVHPREIVKRSLYHNAAAVIFAHNHPSGVARPSTADMVLTCELMDTLKLVGVAVHDHFIVAGMNIVSFAERGLLGVIEIPEASEKQTDPKQSRRKQKAVTRPADPAMGSTSVCHSS